MNLSNVDLNLLVSLDALLTERSVTRAARRVGISQPGMSSALARLRKLTGDPLLVREGNTLVPTARGQSLVEPVRSALNAIEVALDDRLDFNPARDTCTVNVSCSDYSALLVVAPLIRRITAEAPGVTVRLQPRAAEPASMLLRGEADLVIEPVEIMQGANLASETLFEDRWLCCTWQRNSKVGGALDLETYLELPHIVYSMGAGKPASLVDDFLDDLGLNRNVELMVESFLLAPLLLEGTDLITLVLERALSLFKRIADIRVHEPPVQIPPIRQTMWWSPSRTSDPMLSWFRGTLAEVAHDVTAPVSV